MLFAILEILNSAVRRLCVLTAWYHPEPWLKNGYPPEVCKCIDRVYVPIGVGFSESLSLFKLMKLENHTVFHFYHQAYTKWIIIFSIEIRGADTSLKIMPVKIHLALS